MQLMLTLVGVALANLAVAGPCKPSKQTTVNSLSLTVPTTEIAQSSDIPSLSLPESATTTQESEVIITNTFAGGSFAQRDPNTPSGLTGVSTEGQVEFHSGGCYKGDGSKDDGCASLSATGNPAGKRDLGSFASMFQTLNSLSTGQRNKYTVQFYYLVFSAGSQACTISATFGNRQFYSQSLLTLGGVNVQWNQVLQQVEADSSSANFAISMSCSGQGVSMILVDSIFISNQVTPDNIGDFKLDLGGGAADPDPITTSESAPTSASAPAPISTTTGASGIRESNTSSADGSLSTEGPRTVSDSASNTQEPETSTNTPPHTEDATTHAEEPVSTNPPSNTVEPQTASSSFPLGQESQTVTDAASDTEEATAHTEEPVSTNPSFSTDEPLTATNSSPHTQGSQSSSNAATATEDASTHSEQPVSTNFPSSAASKDATGASSIATQSQGSNPQTSNAGQETLSISPAGTSTQAAVPTKTTCKATCETVTNARNHVTDWNCAVYGVYRGSGTIIPAPGQDPDNEGNRVYYSNPGECAELCKSMPGCKTIGYSWAGAWCFLSTSVITPAEVQEVRSDDQDVDWYAMDKCFTCSGCESSSAEASAPAIASTTQAPTQVATTKSSEPTESACLPTCAQRNDWFNHDDWNCQVYGGYRGDFYEFPGQGIDGSDWVGSATQPEQCMAMCKATPGCKSSAISYFWRKCYGSNNVVTQAETREASDDSTDKEWWGPQCFNCVDNECSGSSGKTTTRAPELTTLTTRTSAPATTTTAPADVCIYNRGQLCEFNRFKDHGDTVCIWAGTYPGKTYTVTREDYPYQDGPYQCIAICQTLENCESAGYYSTENRCLFSAKELKTSDMVPGAHDFDNSVWLSNSCVNCPACSDPAPLPQTDKCSYKQGDTCTRKAGKDGALCNYQGMWEWYNEQSLERYPDQSSPEKCMAICQATEYCKGSGYKNGRCMFSFGELKTANFRDWPDHSRDGTWDDPSCFECPGCTE
ncbi:hypothetical protein LB507_010403 [Fusarium sp. FIESC RH6]|nr:hypothetical protein LB507_010403 [Fusarium sp. FIESC RH6]